jgi:Cft2 family RNA processing exonuclease
VTGSKHLINTGDLQVLVDCGLFQGKKEWRERNWQDTPIPAREIDAVILTHAHLDHCGWIPRLYKAGYRGKVYATPATIDLCGVILPDSGHLQEEEADFHNRQHFSHFFGHGNVLSFDRCKSPMFNESPNKESSANWCSQMIKELTCLSQTLAKMTVRKFD